ncbi:hypothetical protein [Paenibacillus soyae]|uniref:Phage tail tape measure protein n=1 Tax=Paenibacillus soyae TaxID=2969249 RepID=A0A9X2MS87_9BACL|nr:hypothetical protein [Paenibacillus soyae]MCR2805337.1 hypothetical protein [Paenibacillus soyae]
MVTEIGSIKARLELKTDNFRSGMARAKRDLREVSIEVDKTARSFDVLESALTAVGASAALVGLVRVVKSLADEANTLAMSLQGVTEVAKALGHDVDAVTQAAEDLAARGFLSVREAADTLKTTLAAGLGLEESIKLTEATADAAAYGREAHLSWGEAIVQVARGIKMGNSELTDAAGITTNLSVFYDRYAKSIGTSAAKLTEAQKVQAAYNGIISEAAMFSGNAETALAGYTGAQTDFNQTLAAARVELGEAYLPTVQKITETITPLIKQFTGWATENKEVVSTVTATVTATLALATAIGVLSVAVRGLNAALGPIGWAITILGGVVTGVSAYTAAANSASAEAREFAANQDALNDALEKTDGILNAQQYKQMTTQMEALNEVLERRNELIEQGTALERLGEQGIGSPETAARLLDIGDAIQAIDKEIKGMGYDNIEAAEFAFRSMGATVDKSLGALADLTRQQMESNIAAADNVATLEALSSEYAKLNELESLSEEQKSRLASIVKQLKQEYPALNAQLDKENRWHIANKDALDGYIRGEKDRVNAAVAAAKKIIETAKTEAEERVRLASAAMTKLAEIEGKSTAAAPFLNEGFAGFIGAGAKAAAERAKTVINDEINQTRFDINHANKLLDDLTVGIDAFRTKTDDTSATAGKSGSSSVSSQTKQTAEQIAQEAYRGALQQLEIRRLLGKLSEEEEEKRLAELAEKYEKYDDIWIDAESRRQRIADQIAADRENQAAESARERFDHSADWIEQETRKMTLAGESEEAIAQMRLEAWTRVRSRYEKDSEYYKRAETELYQLRLDLMRKTEEAAADAQKQAKETADATIKAIDKQKKAELDAIDERRKAIRDLYDMQTKLLDDGERQRERAGLAAEIAKYSGATSEQGRRHLAELQEKLRQMNLDDQRQALEDERDEKLSALDRQQADIESWYADLKTQIEGYNGDFITIYQQTENERFKAFTSTNASILTELERFKSQYESIMSGVGSGNTASVAAQMAANAKAWHTADAAGRSRLSAENQRLGASIGANYDDGSGKWFVDGAPLFHTGGIVGSGNFKAGNMLLPDEIGAILRAGEVVMTPAQIRSMFEAGGNRGGVHIEKLVGMELHDSVFEDEIDVRSMGRSATDMAAEMARKQYTRSV